MPKMNKQMKQTRSYEHTFSLQGHFHGVTLLLGKGTHLSCSENSIEAARQLERHEAVKLQKWGHPGG